MYAHYSFFRVTTKTKKICSNVSKRFFRDNHWKKRLFSFQNVLNNERRPS